jgi:glycosyltransferase involved in cell wall biosynthesis
MMHALQIAGTIAANMTSLSQLLGGAGVDPQPAMAQILARSLADPELCRLGHAGRTLVAGHFSWERVGRDLAAVYSWLAGRGPQPDCVHT